MAPTPVASWLPGGEVYCGDSVTLLTSQASVEHRLTLFDEPAKIRFTPVAATWSGAGRQLSGFVATTVFGDPGVFQLQVLVNYRVDYQIGSDPWIVGAAEILMPSEPISVTVIDPPRRTLLVG